MRTLIEKGGHPTQLHDTVSSLTEEESAGELTSSGDSACEELGESADFQRRLD